MGNFSFHNIHYEIIMFIFSIVICRARSVSAQRGSYCQVSPQHTLCLNTSPSNFCGKVEMIKSRELTNHRQTLISDHRHGSWKLFHLFDKVYTRGLTQVNSTPYKNSTINIRKTTLFVNFWWIFRLLTKRNLLNVESTQLTKYCF